LLVLFAIPAKTRPWHSFEPRLGYGKLADLTHAKPVLTDPNQCILNCPQETSVGLMQPDVHFRFSVGIRLVGAIPSDLRHPVYEGAVSAFIADNPSSLASSNRLYRCMSFAFMIVRRATVSGIHAFYIRILQAVARTRHWPVSCPTPKRSDPHFADLLRRMNLAQ